MTTPKPDSAKAKARGMRDPAAEPADTGPARKKRESYTPREKRIIAGFEDIERFHEDHGRLPQHGEDRDIFERLYAVRLDRLRALEECRTLLRGIDKHGWLDRAADSAELTGRGRGDDITAPRHVRSVEEKRAARPIGHITER